MSPLTIAQGVFGTLQILISLAFILIVAVQTTKNEGLTGTIGGPTTSNFKGKPGFEEQLQHYTMILGVSWFVVSIIVGILHHFG